MTVILDFFSIYITVSTLHFKRLELFHVTFNQYYNVWSNKSILI